MALFAFMLGMAAALNLQDPPDTSYSYAKVYCHTQVQIATRSFMLYELEGVGYRTLNLPDVRIILESESVRAWVTMERDGQQEIPYLEGAATDRIHQDTRQEIYSISEAQKGLFFYFDRWRAQLKVVHYLPDGRIVHSSLDDGDCVISE